MSDIPEDLPEMPPWIDEKIRFSNEREVQDHHILQTFREKEKPFISVSTLTSEHGIGKGGMRKRLAALVELDILESTAGANGHVYWIKDDRSDWPIPPDVEVEPVDDSDELTVSEVVDRDYTRAWGIAVVAAFAASGLLTISLAGLVFNLSVPGDILNNLFLLALLIAVVSVLCAVAGGILFAYDQYRD